MESPAWPRSVAAEADVTLSLELSEIIICCSILYCILYIIVYIVLQSMIWFPLATPETQSGPATKVELSGEMQSFLG